MLGVVGAGDAEAMYSTLIIFDVPDDGTLVCASDVTTDPFYGCSPGATRRGFKIIQVVGNALGAAVINLDWIGVRVEGLR